jgi:hypothetical protein
MTTPATLPVSPAGVTAATPAANPLADLKPIHLPADPAWWPPAPGWWIVAALLLAALLVLGVFLWRKYRWRQWQETVLNEVDHAIARHNQRHLQIAGLSEILRRVALRRYPRERVASLHGAAWLDFLDRHGSADGRFRQGDATVLANAIYRPPNNTDPLRPGDPLVQLVRNWIRRNLS